MGRTTGDGNSASSGMVTTISGFKRAGGLSGLGGRHRAGMRERLVLSKGMESVEDSATVVSEGRAVHSGRPARRVAFPSSAISDQRLVSASGLAASGRDAARLFRQVAAVIKGGHPL